MDNGHESPILVTFITRIQCTLLSQVADDFVRTHEIHAEVSSPAMLDVHGDSDVLQALKVGLLQHILGDLEGNRESINALGNGLVDMNPWRIIPSLWLDWFESLGSLDNGPTINLSVSKCMTKLLSNCGWLPVILFLGEIDRYCGLHN